MSRPTNPFHKVASTYTFHGEAAFYRVIARAMREGRLQERDRIIRRMELDLNRTQDANLAALIERLKGDPLE